MWLIRGKTVGDGSSDGATVTTVSRGSSLLESTLRVGKLRLRHSGQWSCKLLPAATSDGRGGGGGGGGQQRSVDVLVVGSTTKLCPPRMTETPRGRYSWGAAIGGHTVRQECRKRKEEEDGGGGGSVTHEMAHLLCKEGGRWAATANVSQCGYTSRVSGSILLFGYLCAFVVLARCNLSQGLVASQ